MPLRLIEIVLSESEGKKTRDLLKECDLFEYRQMLLPEGQVLVRILLDASECDTVLDLLEKEYEGRKDYRVMMLPVQATLTACK